MATIIECTGSHYEAREAPYGKAYVSYPECVMVEYGEWRKNEPNTCRWSITTG